MIHNDIIRELRKIQRAMLYEGDLQRASTISRTIDFIDRQKAEVERLEKGSLKEAMIFNSNTIKRCSNAAVKEFVQKLKNEIKDECASIHLNTSVYYGVNLHLIDEVEEEFTEGKTDE